MTKPIFKIRKEKDGTYTVWYKKSLNWWHIWHVDHRYEAFEDGGSVAVPNHYQTMKAAEKKAKDINFQLINNTKVSTKTYLETRLFVFNENGEIRHIEN